MARDIAASSNVLFSTDVAAVDITGRFITVFCWINPDSTSGDVGLMTKANYSSGDVQYVMGFAPTVFFQIGDSGGFDQASAGGSFALPTGIWTSVAGVMNGNDLLVWRNPGNAVGLATTARTIQNTGQNFGLGVRNDGGGGQYDGKMAHAAIWDAALTRDEVMRLHQGWLPPQIRPGNLRAYWPLDGYASSGVARDAWKNGAPLSMNGTVTVLPTQKLAETPQPPGGPVLSGPAFMAAYATAGFTQI